MRPVRLSLASFVLTTIPLVACTLDGNSSSSCADGYYGDCYDPSGGGSSSGDYGSGYDSGSSSDPSAPPDCAESFAVAFDAPASSGDCKLELSTYDSSYDTGAVYFFAAPSADERVQCEAVEGPAPGRCFRALETIAFGSTSPDDVAALRAALGLTSTTFTAKLVCANSASEPSKEVAITCAKPVGPSVADDAGAQGDADASTDDASPQAPDAGCGP